MRTSRTAPRITICGISELGEHSAAGVTHVLSLLGPNASGCTARSGCMIVPAGCILGTIPFAAALGLVLMAMQAAP